MVVIVQRIFQLTLCMIKNKSLEHCLKIVSQKFNRRVFRDYVYQPKNLTHKKLSEKLRRMSKNGNGHGGNHLEYKCHCVHGAILLTINNSELSVEIIHFEIPRIMPLETITGKIVEIIRIKNRYTTARMLSQK